MPAVFEIVKKEKKVGLVIHANAPTFSNGIIQNAFFLYQLLGELGMTCDLLCHDENPKPLEYKQIPLKQICRNELVFDPSEYHTIITVTRSLSKDEYYMLKKHKIAVIAFVCGNNLMHDMENFVRGPLGNLITFIGKGAMVDEVWTIPSYGHSIDYLEMTRARPVYTIPHLWSSEILRESALSRFNKPETALEYDLTRHSGKKIEIIVLEPNMALFKNAWVPIMACEKLERTHPEILEQVFVFNFPSYQSSYGMVNSLDVSKKLRKFQRLSMPEIMTYFNERDILPVFLSYQLMNSLNYLYYELLYYGYPLVHNSPDLEGCGYYYPDNDLTKCTEAIMNVHKHHNKNLLTYKDQARAYLHKIDPLNPEVGKVWEQMINESVARSQNVKSDEPASA